MDKEEKKRLFYLSEKIRDCAEDLCSGETILCGFKLGRMYQSLLLDSGYFENNEEKKENESNFKERKYEADEDEDEEITEEQLEMAKNMINKLEKFKDIIEGK